VQYVLIIAQLFRVPYPPAHASLALMFVTS